MSSAGGTRKSSANITPPFEHGCGLPSISGSQTWSLCLGDSRYGSVLFSLLSAFNFTLSDLKED